ncbi:MAG TPA: SMP-30/gluconolactonase/LRE family protein [Acidobacteriaceae bacterium]|nr:SMP-30/gluconolactonase/LRE family protein [Acidobacteriaceae bacterium]
MRTLPFTRGVLGACASIAAIAALPRTLPLMPHVLAAASQASPSLQPEILRLDPALDAIIAPGTKIEKVADTFKFTEGPMWYEGRLWISDVVGDKTYAVSADGVVQLLVDKSGGYPNPPVGSYLGPNAMVTDKDGTVLLAQQGGRQIVRIVRVGDHLELRPFLSTYDGKKFNSPNDLVFAPDGSLWFTDPSYGLALGDKDPAKEFPFNAVFRFAHGKLTPVIKNLTLPNGIGFSPDGKILYVSNSGPDLCVMRYDVLPDGSVSAGVKLIDYPHPIGSGVPDGLKVDAAGNIWSTGPGGVRIIAPSGKVLGQIRLPQTAANLAFADRGTTVYITAQTTVYRIHVVTPGEMPLYQR